MSRPRHRKRRGLIIVIAIVALIGAVGFANRSSIRSAVELAFSADYPGPGGKSLILVVEPGSDGEKITRQLVAADVVKDFSTTYKFVVAVNPTFYPGSFNLKQHMSSRQAIAVLTDPKNAIQNKVTIREGLTLTRVFAELHAATKVSMSEFEQEASNLEQFGVPSQEPSLEGYLFPATYNFEPKSTARQILRIMVNRTFEELDKFEVAKSQRHNVLTLASIIQKEARKSSDFYKVSRVFSNRLKIDMPLQSDATVSYGSGGKTVTTTDAERADQNGFNTYVHRGLPIGPISAPGSLAIRAALHPAKGSWLYFCAVNLKTGETVFSTTIAEHNVAVAKFQKWIRENPSWNG